MRFSTLTVEDNYTIIHRDVILKKLSPDQVPIIMSMKV